ncbi:DUF1987 domain-containing protein [Clostridium sp. WILCCON 0269]|uniref:DUF1987 domain-containing protein n=1 Tax=Candidatus Clostridium eludens TaxID=3381663 RepID=A0ABW8SIE1_9CLOT
MNNLIIEKTASTPHINFNYEMRKLIVSGESFPENAAKFYEPVMNWIKEYLEKIGREATQVEFEIIYFNSSTSKIYMTLFTLLDQAVSSGKNIVINWRAAQENETAIECGEEFMEDVEFVKFNILVE